MSLAEPVERQPAKTPVAPAAPGRRRAALNLARRPFVNTRPVVRTALLLWIAGALLLAGNVTLFWSYLAGSDEMRAEIGRTERRIEEERRRAAQLEAQIAGYDLEKQNRQVEYLNRKIAERTFSWSLLFDRLAEVLPDEVRLHRLSPSGVVQDERRRGRTVRREDTDGRVLLTIAGAAKDGEALLRFVDNLFTHSAFDNPDLTRESVDEEEGVLLYEVVVEYLPETAAEEAVLIEEVPAASPVPEGASPAPGGDPR
jgi:Tfp pilus assembly protein PilN